MMSSIGILNARFILTMRNVNAYNSIELTVSLLCFILTMRNVNTKHSKKWSKESEVLY